MQKVVCIPLEQYELMLKSYDEAIEQLDEIKEILARRNQGEVARHEEE